MMAACKLQIALERQGVVVLHQSIVLQQTTGPQCGSSTILFVLVHKVEYIEWRVEIRSSSDLYQ